MNNDIFKLKPDDYKEINDAVVKLTNAILNVDLYEKISAEQDLNHKIELLMVAFALRAVSDHEKQREAEPEQPDSPQPFDLEAAKRGDPLVARDGRKAKFVAHVPESEKYPVVAIIEGDECFGAFTRDGKWSAGIINSTFDLFMAPRPMRTVYVNFYPGKPTPNAVVWDHKLQAEYNALEDAIAVAVPVQIPA